MYRMCRQFNTCDSLLDVNVRIRDIVVCPVSTISHYFPPRSLQKLLWNPKRDAQCRLSAYGVSGFITWQQSVRSIRLAPAALKNSACGNVKKDMSRRAWRSEICARSESAARNMERVSSSAAAWRRKQGISQCIKSNIKPNARQI